MVEGLSSGCRGGASGLDRRRRVLRQGLLRLNPAPLRPYDRVNFSCSVPNKSHMLTVSHSCSMQNELFHDASPLPTPATRPGVGKENRQTSQQDPGAKQPTLNLTLNPEPSLPSSNTALHSTSLGLDRNMWHRLRVCGL